MMVFILRFAFLLLFFVSWSDGACRGHVRSALVKGNVPSITHAGLTGGFAQKLSELFRWGVDSITRGGDAGYENEALEGSPSLRLK